MNAAAIESAAKEISRLTLALGWLRSHGLQALMPVGDAFSVVVSLNSCSALPGAKEAATQLGAQARLVMGGEVLANAIKDAENTIEILREKIAREVAHETK